MRLLAAAALWPTWLRRAFADVTVHGDALLRRDGRRDGPTLVLIVPRDDHDKWDRGEAFGELLNYGSDRDLAPLALVDVVCLPAQKLDIKGDPLMVFVDGGKQQLLDGKLPRIPNDAFSEVLAGGDSPAQIAASDARIALLSRLIRRALGPRRDADARSDASLATLARARYVKRPPPGTHWAHSGGCGYTIEGAPDLNHDVDCGMGHVPHRSARFLYFLTRR
jgi:hypothetical protein